MRPSQDGAREKTVRLETPRMRMREFTTDDADLLYELDADPLVMRFINGGRETPRDEVEHDVLPRLMRWYAVRPDLGHWAAELRDTGDFVGWFGLSPVDTDPTDLVLGYRLRREFWGQGLATEGCRALVRQAFTDIGAVRVSAETMTVNRASRRVLEKAGLRFSHTFFAEWPDVIEGSDLGDVQYAVTRGAWLASLRRSRR
jgi:RimJ/RimL family protein N-acetyltransferase